MIGAVKMDGPFCIFDDPLCWDVEDHFMEQHEPLDTTRIGHDFEDLEQRRLDALRELLFDGIETLNVCEDDTASKIGSGAFFDKSLVDVPALHDHEAASRQYSVSTLEKDELNALYRRGASDEEIRKSLAFAENSAWVKKLVDEGHTVVDLGGPIGSVFYEMEKFWLFFGR